MIFYYFDQLVNQIKQYSHGKIMKFQLRWQLKYVWIW